MWKLEENKLINKANIWRSPDNWKLPEPGTEDIIENTSSKTFLDIYNTDHITTLAGFGNFKRAFLAKHWESIFYFSLNIGAHSFFSY